MPKRWVGVVGRGPACGSGGASYTGTDPADLIWEIANSGNTGVSVVSGTGGTRITMDAGNRIITFTDFDFGLSDIQIYHYDTDGTTVLSSSPLFTTGTTVTWGVSLGAGEMIGATISNPGEPGPDLGDTTWSVCPGISGVYFLEVESGSTYLSTESGYQNLRWDETTQVATPNASYLNFDDDVSLVFIQVLQPVKILSALSYGYVDWAGTLALNSVHLKLQFYSDEFTLQDEFVTDNSGSTVELSGFMDYDVTLPAGGLIAVEVLHDGTPTTFTYTGEIELLWVSA